MCLLVSWSQLQWYYTGSVLNHGVKTNFVLSPSIASQRTFSNSLLLPPSGGLPSQSRLLGIVNEMTPPMQTKAVAEVGRQWMKQIILTNKQTRLSAQCLMLVTGQRKEHRLHNLNLDVWNSIKIEMSWVLEGAIDGKLCIRFLMNCCDKNANMGKYHIRLCSEVGNVAQWQSACPTSVRPCVQFIQEINNRTSGCL